MGVFVDTLIKVLVLIALAVPGFLLTKAKKLDGEAPKYIVNVIFYVCQPIIVITSFQKVSYRSEMLINMGLAFLFGFVGILAVTAAVRLIAKKLIRGKEGLAAYAVGFGNVAFMGIPVISMLMPKYPEALIYLTVLTVAFNMLSWTLGAYVMSGKREYITLKKALLNPPTLAVLIALPLFLLNIRIDSTALRGFEYLGDMVTPLSMTILGIRFANMPLKELFGDLRVYAVTVMKLVIVPLIFYCVLRLVRVDKILATTMYIIFLMPCASNLLLFAEHFGQDRPLAAKCVLFSTLVSAITIPTLLLLPL